MGEGAPIPPNEIERLKEVAKFCPTDSDSDDVFEKIVEMASAYYNAPIALISIVDKHRQWFRARVGITETQTPREVSFCAYSTLDNALLEVSDATLDARFKDNPLVTGPPHIRYYAGAPLITEDGFTLGSLCIIDTVPRPPMSERDSAMLNDFAELVMMRIQGMRSRNFVDQPTGLFNRLRLEEDIRQALKLENACHVYAVDIISPKFLNDIVKALGYSFAGDLVLAIKSRLQNLLPAQCLLYKISPTRFGFILEENQTTEHICESILKDFKKPVECHGIPILMQVGIGVLPIHHSGQQDWLRLLVSAADEARDRKLGWSLYEPQFDAAQQRAFMLLSSLPEAVSCDKQFSLVYQPKIKLPSGSCDSVEALLRWNHPLLGPISPAEFIPLAEKTALIPSVGLWVLKAIIRQAAAWKAQGVRLRIAMNITVSDLESSEFVDAMIHELHRHDLDPADFELEFTESMLMTNPEEVIRQLQRVRQIGIEVAVDDFGTGYSNWAYLKELPATTVKLDQSLISGLGSNQNDKQLVKTLIGLAKGLGYRVVAEGVENQEILDLLIQWGCSEAQGYLIAKPMTATDLETWISPGR
ncbi:MULTISPECIES: EAL domain-containing protein [unclassified Pseudomonas]|uniref:sensor domain-containing phosphodiesterase n=1 Tax=unclassified Pseudomonas TaxID=196821 RepID=UPI000C86CC78|nr:MULTISPECIES: EAL domain-containing protein [unclassified Pseudomonas]PMU26000.1 sensor domain-containing phosphodiesterase [Pseudomonas sp. GP01-A9]PMU32163.1 sensor domain-containing phosphodiesterase [Pseudomonas sp. GP01-A13]PMU39740.1 sensor domain-containing phosphodiesterase [Pseudomonas sp. GP01-A8]PMU56216.1 sensor domain-containing phosphodiesterase [Pseudomonas sp. GP01-A14]PMU57039.1 sensor domain-containing phosphodiesterase [Pseudomonas sp. GP01-A6]